MDKVSKSKRSKMMSGIKSKNTKPELWVRKYLRARGVFYRCNVKGLPGRPDIAIKKYRIALNVHGCFWHGHNNCKDFRFPKTNLDFWRAKIASNIQRDHLNNLKLKNLGYQYWEIWECELLKKDYSKLDEFIGVYKKNKNNFKFLNK